MKTNLENKIDLILAYILAKEWKDECEGQLSIYLEGDYGNLNNLAENKKLEENEREDFINSRNNYQSSLRAHAISIENIRRIIK